MHAITEATLEMHFHSGLMNLFRETYGLGSTGSINFFKYAPQHEKFIGFDQAYVRTELSPAALYSALRAMIQNPAAASKVKVVGYFLQFKVLKRLERRSRAIPAGFSTPYFRASLRTQRQKGNDPSQHELLFALAQNPGSMVYYACPMVFDQAELYRPVADLDQLRLADVGSAPGAFLDNQAHSLCFQTKVAQPVWCSDPVEGKTIPPRDFVNRLRDLLDSPDLRQSNAKSVLELLQRRTVLPDASDESDFASLAQSLTLVVVVAPSKAA